MFRDTYPVTSAPSAVRSAIPDLTRVQEPAPPWLPDHVAHNAAHQSAPLASVLPALGEVTERRFALYDILDDRGHVQARDLLFRPDSQRLLPGAGHSLDRAGRALANALLDGLAAGCLPEGRLFVSMDETCLNSPMAEAVTADIGAITLTLDLGISAPLLMRVAALRAKGVRFSIAGVRSEADPLWLLAPYADTFRLDLPTTPPDRVTALAEQAEAHGLEVIGTGVRSMSGYQRLADLAVPLRQGPFIAVAQERTVAALPGCDLATLKRTQRLLDNRVSFDAVAVAVAADPALVMRLHLLHRLYGAARGTTPRSLAGLLAALPPAVLGAWLEILRRTACHDHHRGWARSVRGQVEVYRLGLRRRSDGDDHEAIQEATWIFLKRLTQPVHYFKTLRYPE